MYARHLPNFHHNSSRDAWAWIACDLHAQVGAWLHLLKFGRHPPFDFLWTIDADVAWTGNLGVMEVLLEKGLVLEEVTDEMMTGSHGPSVVAQHTNACGKMPVILPPPKQ